MTNERNRVRDGHTKAPRAWWLVALAAAGAVAAACSGLFEDPVQCTTDQDCAAFPGTTCGPDRVCIGGSGDAGTGNPGDDSGTVTPGQDASDDSGIDPLACTRTPKPIENVGTAMMVTSYASSRRWSCAKDYVISGTINIEAGATLTIDPGTTIRADGTDAAIVVKPGATLMAAGTEQMPIIFTSNKLAADRAPGDWRGVFVLGEAPPQNMNGFQNDANLAYGGAQDASNSGTLTYARIEYTQSGIVFGGVGSATTLHHIQSRRTGGDCITFTGGRANAKHMVCQHPGDEPFEFTGGYEGKLQFILAQRTPLQGGGHNGLIVTGARPVIYNATLCGAEVVNQGGIGVVPRGGSGLGLHNAVVMGYTAGLDTIGNAGLNLDITSTVFFMNHTTNVAFVELTDGGGAGNTLDDDNAFDELAFFGEGARNNIETDPQVGACFNATAPDFAPAAALTANAATPPADGFFDVAAVYRGAVKDAADTWVKAGWLVFADN